MSASNRRSRVLLQAIMATGVVAALALAARAQLPITQIVATGDPAPDGGTYVSFGAPISVVRQTPVEVPNIFAFQATTSNNVSGVYYYSYNDPAHGGNLLQEGTVADTTQTAPTGGTYSSFSSLSGGYGELGFIATDSGRNQGVYSVGQSIDGPILIATPQTLTPTGVPFGNFQSISLMSDQYFGIEGGEIESDAGIYDFDSLGGPSENQLEFTLVANTSTTPPGASGPFTSFGPVSYKNIIEGSNTPGIYARIRAVCATVGAVPGIYYGSIGGPAGQGAGRTFSPLVDLVNVGSTTPDGTGQFTNFGNPIATSNEILFTAQYSTANGDEQGIFAFGPYEEQLNGYSQFPVATVHQIVATGQVAPDSAGATFTGFSDISDSSYNDTFLAGLSNGEEGLYVYIGEGTNIYNPGQPPPELFKVIATGDMLDGKIVSGIELSPDGSNYYDLSSDADVLGIDFEVSFTDGSESLDYFIVPEPASLCFMALPLLLLARRRRSGKLSAAQNGSMIEPLEQRRLLSSPSLTPIGIDAVNDPTYGGLVAGSDDPTVEADNTTILNRAIATVSGSRNGASGGVVYLPEGTYYFSGSIDLVHLVTLRGESATGENDGTNGTIIDYAGGDTAIKLTPASNGDLWNTDIQNLTIESNGNGVGLYDPGDANDPPLGVVRFDMENVKFETEGTAIDLPENDGGEAAQNSYFHNIYISIGGPESSDPETSIYLASGDEAVDLGGNANDIDGLTIGGTPAAGYSPAKGLIDIENSKVLLLKDINIPATFGSQSITDFYIYRGSNVAIQNVWINRAFAGSDTEPAGSNTEYEIIQCDVTIDSMALDSNDILDVDPAAEYVPASYHQPSIVVVDSLQFNTEDNTQTPTLADCIKANSISEVHVTLATQPYISSWPTGVDQPALDSSGALVPYEGVDVETADPTHVVSPNNSALMNHDYLQWWISTYPGMILYIPAGQYDISTLLTIPSGTEIEGEGEFSTTINCGDSAVLSLSNPGGGTDFSDVTISDLGMDNTNSSGVGINADYSPLTGTDNISHLSVNQVFFDTTADGIDLPAPDADITDGSFVNLYLNGNSPGLIAIHVDGNTAGNVTTLEECNDPEGSGPEGPIVSVDNDPDSTEPVFVYACDEERNDAVFFELSGPDINFFGNYISDGSSLNCVQLDDVTNFQADTLPSGGYYGSGSLITSDSTVYIRYMDAASNTYDDPNHDGDPIISPFYDSSDLSNSVMDVTPGSTVNLDVVRYFGGANIYGAQGYFYPTTAGLLNSILTNSSFHIAVVNDGSGGSSSGAPGPSLVLGTPGAVPSPFNDVVISNGSSTTLTSSSTDPNQITVTGASNTNQINVISNNAPYIIVQSGGGDTLTVDWSAGTPNLAGSLYFDASGTGNKIVVDDPAEADNLTFVQGPPPDNTPGLIGLSNVQEIDTGTGSYDVTLDLSSGVPSTGICYNATGGDATILLKTPDTGNPFTLEDTPFAVADDLAIQGVSAVEVAAGSEPYLNLADIGADVEIDSVSDNLINVNGDYELDMDNIDGVSFTLDQQVGSNDINISSLPTTAVYTVYGYASLINIYGDSSEDAFAVSASGVNVNNNQIGIINEESVVLGDSTITLYDNAATTTTPGQLIFDYSGGSPMPAEYVGTGGNLDVYNENGDSYTYVSNNGYAGIATIYFGISTVTFHAEDGDATLSFPLQNAGGRSAGYGLPSYTVSFYGSSGDSDTVDIDADSTYDSFEIGGYVGDDAGAEIIVNPQSTTPYVITTTGVEKVNIRGGSEADSVTVDADSAFSNVTFTGGGGTNSLTLDESNDEFAIGAGQVTYDTSGETVSFSGLSSVTLQGSGGVDEISADGGGSQAFTLSADSLAAFGCNFAIDGISNITLETCSVVYSGTSGDDTFYLYRQNNTDTLYADGPEIYLDSVSSLTINTGGGDDTYCSGLGGNGAADIQPTIVVPEGSSIYLEGIGTGGIIYLSGLSADPNDVSVKSGWTYQVE